MLLNERYIYSAEYDHYEIIRKNANLALHFEHINSQYNSIYNHKKDCIQLLDSINRFIVDNKELNCFYLKLIHSEISGICALSEDNPVEACKYLYSGNHLFSYGLLVCTLMRHNFECAIEIALTNSPDLYYKKISDNEFSVLNEDNDKLLNGSGKKLRNLRAALNKIVHIGNPEEITKNKDVDDKYRSLFDYYSYLKRIVKRGVDITPKGKIYDGNIVVIFCLLLGLFGGHRFYTGSKKLGTLYLVSLGLVGVGVVADLIKIIKGDYKDKNNNYVEKPHRIIRAGCVAVLILALILLLLILAKAHNLI